jgi:hypothetical protein
VLRRVFQQLAKRDKGFAAANAVLLRRIAGSVGKKPLITSLPGGGAAAGILPLRLCPTPSWDSGFLRFAQDFGRRLGRRLNASTSLRSE